MKSNLTILIPTSPIPSHPSTSILDETIANIRQYTDAEIIIMFDGVHSSLAHRAEDYNEYKEAVRRKKHEYGWCNMAEFPDHQHQANMTRRTLDFVKTPLVMFCEHDTSPIGEIPWGLICGFVEMSPIVNCLRFNIFDRLHEEHLHLMLDKKPEFYYQEIVGGNVSEPIMAARTIQWSQRPHIAKTDWYRGILANYFPSTHRTMIEDVMHSVVQESYKHKREDIFGLAIYTPEGNQLRSYHSDGRGADTKIIDG